MTQLVMMRELMGAFEGNELILGAVLGNWLLLMGAGAALGRWSERLRCGEGVLAALQAVLAVLPVAMLLAVRGLRHELFLRGSTVGLSEITVFAFALLLPYCLASGFLLALACGLLGRSAGPAGPARAYTLDSLGSLAGGAIFSFILIRHVNHTTALYLAGGLNLVAAAAVAWSSRRPRLGATIVWVTAVLAAPAVAFDLEAWSIQLQHHREQVLSSRQTPYGRIDLVCRFRSATLFDAARPLFPLRHTPESAELVHATLAHRPAARSVLVIGGGPAGLLYELGKWPIERIDYVELDATLVETAWRHGEPGLKDPRVRLIFDDARRFLLQSGLHYDVILLDVGEPGTFQVNRFYTREFFELARRALGPGGVLAFRMGHQAGHVPPEMADMLATVHRTLGESFAHVRMLAFSNVQFLASGAELAADLSKPIRPGGVADGAGEAWHPTPSILANATAPLRQAALRRAVQRPAQVNRDFNPVLYRHQLRLWVSEFPLSFGLLEGLLLAVLVVYLVRLRSVGLVVFATGFASSGLQIVLLIGFQIVHGYVYEGAGAMITLFMAGLVAGSWLAARNVPARALDGEEEERLAASLRARRGLIVLALLLAGLAAALPLLLQGLAGLQQVSASAADLARPVFLGLSLTVGLLTGWIFPTATRAHYESPARTGSKVYTADFVGSCLGSLLTATLLIPLLGVFTACWIPAGLSALAAIALLERLRAYRPL